MRVGQNILEPALKRFIYREFKKTSIIQDSILNTPLHYYVLSEYFPWSAGDEIIDDEIERVHDAN